MRCSTGRFTLIALLALVLVLGLPGCRNTPPSAPVQPTQTPNPEPSEPETPPEESAEPQSVNVYFARAEKIGAAGRTVTPADDSASAVAYAAVQELLLGPSAQEREFGLTTAVPANTAVNGVVVEDGVATVDLSPEFESGGGSLSMQMRVAQVVCTLTYLDAVDTVAFAIDGEKIESVGGEGVMVDPPVDRADFEEMLPAILVETPTPGLTVSSPLTVGGSSNVFEATHQIEVTDPEGKIVATKAVTATSGTGTRGTWSESVPYENDYPNRLGAVIVFEYSAKDGSRINLVEIPVMME